MARGINHAKAKTRPRLTGAESVRRIRSKELKNPWTHVKRADVKHIDPNSPEGRALTERLLHGR
jgi:hypothetical protein